MQVRIISCNVNFEDSESSMEIGDECPGTAEIKKTTEQVRFTF